MVLSRSTPDSLGSSKGRFSKETQTVGGPEEGPAAGRAHEPGTPDGGDEGGGCSEVGMGEKLLGSVSARSEGAWQVQRLRAEDPGGQGRAGPTEPPSSWIRRSGWRSRGPSARENPLASSFKAKESVRPQSGPHESLRFVVSSVYQLGRSLAVCPRTRLTHGKCSY